MRFIAHRSLSQAYILSPHGRFFLQRQFCTKSGTGCCRDRRAEEARINVGVDPVARYNCRPSVSHLCDLSHSTHYVKLMLYCFSAKVDRLLLTMHKTLLIDLLTYVQKDNSRIRHQLADWTSRGIADAAGSSTCYGRPME